MTSQPSGSAAEMNIGILTATIQEVSEEIPADMAMSAFDPLASADSFVAAAIQQSESETLVELQTYLSQAVRHLVKAHTFLGIARRDLAAYIASIGTVHVPSDRVHQTPNVSREEEVIRLIRLLNQCGVELLPEAYRDLSNVYEIDAGETVTEVVLPGASGERPLIFASRSFAGCMGIASVIERSDGSRAVFVGHILPEYGEDIIPDSPEHASVIRNIAAYHHFLQEHASTEGARGHVALFVPYTCDSYGRLLCQLAPQLRDVLADALPPHDSVRLSEHPYAAMDETGEPPLRDPATLAIQLQPGKPEEIYVDGFVIDTK